MSANLNRTRWIDLPLDPDEPNPLDARALSRLGDGDEVRVRDRFDNLVTATISTRHGFAFLGADGEGIDVSSVEVAR